MIKSLLVKNIALIDELNIEFSEGLNVLSGETGAGKSILVDAMNLVLGERADRDLIRNGQEKAHVEAVIKINMETFKDFFEENLLDMEDELIISRELSVSGKNVCRMNGTVVSLSALKELTDRIIDLHGQHEHQSLLYAKNHLEFIDNFGGKSIGEIKGSVHEKYAEYQDLQNKLSQIGGDEKQRAHSIDLLEYQISEITEAAVKINESEDLKTERELLRNSQNISQALNYGYDALYLGEGGECALTSIQNTIDQIEDIASYDEKYARILSSLKDGYYTIEDCAHEMHDLAEQVPFDEQRQAEIEERIDIINSLKRKYGTDEEEILQFLDDAQHQLCDLQNSEVLLKKLNTDITAVKHQLYEYYVELSNARKEAAKALCTLVIKELNDLGMSHAKFEARFEPLALENSTRFSKNGIDSTEFYISTNAGEPLKPLSKTASGGEISRIMLAFKNISAGIDDISTMIFDEIDTGISGRMALVVSQKMASISRSRQVICVTHLPQIASMADRNFLITKQSANNITKTSVACLAGDEVFSEIARLSGGIQTQNSISFAKELIDQASEYKAGI
ncbi:MAG: DNA repair protein RecN [Christensenellaceae bacterium]